MKPKFFEIYLLSAQFVQPPAQNPARIVLYIYFNQSFTIENSKLVFLVLLHHNFFSTQNLHTGIKIKEGIFLHNILGSMVFKICHKILNW